tara:strand:+ start:264 stop:488 length:225 start_codon:yes stop_codon:yes gene_type:complete
MNKDEIDVGSVSHRFNCFLCGGNFKRVGEPCVHYDDDEMDEGGEVSLCDGCNEYAVNKAKKENIKGLSRRFINN